MGASKTHQYSTFLIKKAKVANALGHPARLRIIQSLHEYPILRATDLESILSLSKSTVHTHVHKLERVGIVKLDFYPNEYHIRLNSRFEFDYQAIFEN